jgi:hypothetical protein
MNTIYHSNILYKIGGWTPFMTMYIHLGTLNDLIIHKYPNLHELMKKSMFVIKVLSKYTESPPSKTVMLSVIF